MADTRARVERMAGSGGSSAGGLDGGDRGRFRLFLLVFLVVLVAGLGYTLFQPSIYRSSASVLMSAPRAIDAPAAEEDAQNVAIQRRVLLGDAILAATADELEARDLAISTAALREMLSVEAVPETNLVELAATGSEPGLLPEVVDAWITVYSAIRARELGDSKASSMSRAEEELAALDLRITEARSALAAFRAENAIVSVEREQNAVMSRLDGLNEALREAEAEEVRSKAYLETVRQAIAEERLVLPDAQRGELQALEEERDELRTELVVLRKRFTPEYIERDATLRQLPRRLEEVQAEITELMDRGRQLELANARRAYDAARAAVRELETRIGEHRAAVAEFNETYATHAALQGDIERLEEIKREANARLVQLDVRRVDKYPEVTVIGAPSPMSTRLGPNHWLLAGFSLAAALLAGIGAVWLRSFLFPSRSQPAYVTLSGVHLYPAQGEGELAYDGDNDPRLQRMQAGRLGRRSDDRRDPDAG